MAWPVLNGPRLAGGERIDRFLDSGWWKASPAARAYDWSPYSGRKLRRAVQIGVRVRLGHLYSRAATP